VGLRSPDGQSVVYRNAGTVPITSNGGQGFFPPGVVWYGPGVAPPDNFSVIRFTVPPGAGGNYEVSTAARAQFDGSLSSDADFHVLRNDVEVFGQDIPPRSATGYTNVLNLAAGDTLDFLCGRGPDGSQYGGGLKISVNINRRPDLPVTIFDQPQSQTVRESAPATFRIATIGSPTPTHQWFRDGAALGGATNVTYSIPGARV